MTWMRNAAWLLLVVLIAGPGWAQEPPQDELAAIRDKSNLTADDRANLQTWLSARVTRVVGGDVGTANAAYQQLRRAYRGTEAFRDGYAGVLGELVRNAYRKAELAPASRLIALFNVIRAPQVLPLLLDALQDERTAVRAAAAIALRSHRPQVSGNPERVERVLNALQQAGRREDARETLQEIYRAMDYSQVEAGADRRAAATALLALLEERVAQLQQARPRAEAAENIGLKVAQRLRPAMGDAMQRRYVTAAGQLLNWAVRRYTGGDDPLSQARRGEAGPDVIELRDQVERVIYEAERALREMVRASDLPEVTDRMEQADYVNMQNELNRWARLLREQLGIELPR